MWYDHSGMCICKKWIVFVVCCLLQLFASSRQIVPSRAEHAILLRALGPLTAAATISSVDQARLPDQSNFIIDKTDGDLRIVNCNNKVSMQISSVSADKHQKRAKNERISVIARVTSSEISGFEVSPRLKKPCCIVGKSIHAEPTGRAASNEPPAS